METRLSLILNGTYYNQKVTIPENFSVKHYFEDTVEKIVNQKGIELKAILLEVGDGTYVYQSSGIHTKIESAEEAHYCSIWETVLGYSNSPIFVAMHQKNISTNTEYFEIPLLAVHPELYVYIPIHDSITVKLFVEFVINTLNINWHPDSEFIDYLDEKEFITDAEGNKILFKTVACEFMDKLTEVCFDIVGDKLYEIGFEVQQAKLKGFGIELGTQSEGGMSVEEKLAWLNEKGVLTNQYAEIPEHPSDQEIIGAYEYFIVQGNINEQQDQIIGTEGDTIKKMASMYTGQQAGPDQRVFPPNTLDYNPPLTNDEKEVKEFDWNHATIDERKLVLLEAEPIWTDERLSEYSALDYEDLSADVRMKLEKSASLPMVIKYFASEYGENTEILTRAGREMIVVYFDPTQEEPGGRMAQELMTNPELNSYLGGIDWTTNEITFHFDSSVFKEEEFEEEQEWNPMESKQYVKDLLNKTFGPENQYSGSADWGGIPTWTVKGDKFTGLFVVIDDDGDIVLLNREFDEENEENIDNTLYVCNIDLLIKKTLPELIKVALDWKEKGVPPLNN